jgi:hypothetical protein
MNAGAAVVDRAELIMWCDALDKLAGNPGPRDVEKGLQMARECQHPDAVWLSSRFPSGAEATPQRMWEMMREQGDDPRAMWLAWACGGRQGDDEGLLRRAAERGYARAQVSLARLPGNLVERIPLLEKAAAQNDRDALCMLGFREMRDQGEDKAKAIELFRRAAELNDGDALWTYGELAFRSDDWQRYHWWGRAALRGFDLEVCSAVLELLPSFEEGGNGRILHTIAPLLLSNIDLENGMVFGEVYSADEVRQFARVTELHNVMMSRARAAIDCWSMAGRRCGIVKDMRVMIAKTAWAEVWRWGEK